MKRPELSPQLGSSFQAKCSNCHPNFIKPYPMKHELPVFALLIDADNVNKEAIVPIIEEVTRHGRIAVRRVYGDFTTPHLAGWRETLANLFVLIVDLDRFTASTPFSSTGTPSEKMLATVH